MVAENVLVRDVDDLALLDNTDLINRIVIFGLNVCFVLVTRGEIVI